MSPTDAETEGPDEILLHAPDGAGFRSNRVLAVGLGCLGWVMAFCIGSTFSHDLDRVFLGASAVVALAALGIWWIWRCARAPIRLHRADGQVIGLRRPLPVGNATVRVTTSEKRAVGEDDTYTVRSLTYVPDGPNGAEAEVLFRACEDPIRTREAAEALCKIGRWRMEWVVANGRAPEVRAPEELDVPLVRRARALLETEPRRPARIRWRCDRRGANGLLLRPRLLHQVLAGLGLTAIAVVIASPMASLYLSWLGDHSSVTIAGAVVTVLILEAPLSFVLLPLARFGLRFFQEIEATREGIVLRRHTLRSCFGKRTLPVGAIESIRPAKNIRSLELVGDGFSEEVGPFSSAAEADYFRHALTSALQGELPGNLFEPEAA